MVATTDKELPGQRLSVGGGLPSMLHSSPESMKNSLGTEALVPLDCELLDEEESLEVFSSSSEAISNGSTSPKDGMTNYDRNKM